MKKESAYHVLGNLGVDLRKVSISGVWHNFECPHCAVGKEVGGLTSKGYVRIILDGDSYLAHRLAWYYMTGDWPVNQVDHRDLDKTNNRWDNLRPATNAQNHQSKRLQKNNTTGVTGVSYNARTGKFYASIKANGHKHYLGTFDTLQGAAHARATAKKSLHTFQPIAPYT